MFSAAGWPSGWMPKSKPAPGDILSGLGRLAFSSTGKRPLSISQFVVVPAVHCKVFSFRKKTRPATNEVAGWGTNETLIEHGCCRGRGVSEQLSFRNLKIGLIADRIEVTSICNR